MVPPMVSNWATKGGKFAWLQVVKNHGTTNYQKDGPSTVSSSAVRHMCLAVHESLRSAFTVVNAGSSPSMFALSAALTIPVKSLTSTYD